MYARTELPGNNAAARAAGEMWRPATSGQPPRLLKATGCEPASLMPQAVSPNANAARSAESDRLCTATVQSRTLCAGVVWGVVCCVVVKCGVVCGGV